jgi:hypothetical protein
LSILSHIIKPDPIKADHPQPWTEREAGAPRIYMDGEILPNAQRLVIILPDANFDVFNLPRRILKLTAPERHQVLLVARPAAEENENRLRLRLATLASLVRDPFTTVAIQLVTEMPLELAVVQLSQPGDLLVCFAEHRLPRLTRQPALAYVLAQQTHLPVYTLDGTVHEHQLNAQPRWIELITLLLGLASLVVFYIMEVWLDKHTTGGVRTGILIAAGVMEIWMIGRIVTRSSHL